MDRLQKVYGLLLEGFGEQGWWPLGGRYSPEFKRRRKTGRERFEIAVGAILTQSTSWKNVEKALESMRKSNALSRERIRSLPVKRLAKIIQSAGYRNQKAKKLKEFVKFKGEVTRENLLSIWGVGEETADSILLYAHDRPVFVVDAYTRRVAQRLGIANGVKYSELQRIFEQSLPRDAQLFSEYHALLVELGKKHCKKNPECGGCPVLGLCRNGKGVNKKTVDGWE